MNSGEIKKRLDNLYYMLEQEGKYTKANTAAFAIEHIEKLEAQLEDWKKSQHYRYIGRDGKATLARDIENKLIETEAALQNEIGYKNAAYSERNKLVALLASLYPSGIKKTAIEGWDEAWHGCVYIDFPWGQASWHYHVTEAHLFSHLPPYEGEWDGHTTEQKYEAITRFAKSVDI